MYTKGRERKLTSLILTALMLGNGSFYAPVAEAEVVEINPSNLSEKTYAEHGVHNAYGYIWPKITTDSLLIKYNGTDWQSWSFAGGYSEADDEDVNNRAITLKQGSVGVIYGGRQNYTNALGATNYNTVTVEGGTVGLVYGGFSQKGSASGNTINISDGRVESDIYGGYSASGSAGSNTITISGNARIDGSVIGGKGGGSSSLCNGNTIIINGGTFSSTNTSIWGGWTDHSGGRSGTNFIEIHAPISVLAIYGGNQYSSTLTLGATGISVGSDLSGFNKIVYDSNIGLASDKTVLSVSGNVYQPTAAYTTFDLDARYLYNQNTLGTMTLLSAGNSLNGVRFLINNDTGYVLSGASGGNRVQEVYSDASSTVESGKAVNFTYKNTHTVYMPKSDGSMPTSNSDTVDSTKIKYTIANKVSSMAFASTSVAWGSAALRSGSGFTFTGGSSGTIINAAGLSFNKYDGLEGLIKKNDTMTLLSDASGLASGNTVNDGSKTFKIEGYTDTHGIKFDGTVAGTVKSATNAVNFEVSGVTLDKIDLSGWKGAETNPGSAIPDTWTTGTGVTVTTGSFASTPTANTVIFSTNTTGLFNDNNITGAKRYSDSEEFSGDTDAGVTFSGNKGGGVKATDNGKSLTYFAELLNTKNITLGDMAWGTGRVAGDGYNFGSIENNDVDATNLTFTNPLAVGAVGSTMALLSNATDLAANKTVIDGTGHSQTFNGEAASNGVKLDGTIVGNVSTAAKAVNYEVTAKSITGADLSGWDSTKNAVDLTGWSSGLEENSIIAEGFTAPNVTAGQSVNILTAGSNFFSEGQITGSQKYDVDVKTTTSDTDKGVTFTGSQSKGVAASSDGTKLQYVAGDMAVTDITLGNMEVANIPRDASAGSYNFTDSTKIDATNLKFDKPQDVTTGALVTGATNITASNPVTGADHSQAITNAAMGSGGITVSGTLNGTVEAVANGVNYTVNNKTVSSMDLSGWDATTENTTLPDATLAETERKWTGSNVSVKAETFAAAAPTADKNIFTTDIEGFFGDVTGALAYKSGAAFSGDEDKGVTLSGTKSGGVKKSDDGKELNFIAELSTVNNISLGAMGWKDGRTIDGNYDFSNVKANGVDATNLSFNFGDQAKSITSADNWDLLDNANNLAADLTVKGSKASQKISYTVDNVATLSGTLTGDVTTTAGKVHYDVDEKTLTAIDISNWNGESSTETIELGNWTNDTAEGVSITGAKFTQPAAGNKLDYTILKSNTDGFFSNANIDDSIIFKNSRAYSETDKGITLSGTQGRGITANDDGDKLVYRVGAANISSILLGSVTYTKDGTWLEKNSDFYDYTNLSTLNTSGFAMSMTDEQKKAAAVGNSMTLVLGNDTLDKDIAAQSAGSSNYSYNATTGIAVGGTVSGSVSADGANNKVLYTVTGNKATTLNLSTVKWGETYDRSGSDLNFKDAVVDSSNIYFTGETSLSKGQTMTLISNYGGDINKTRSGIFTLADGSKGKGYAYYDKTNDSLMYKVTLGNGETQETVTVSNQKAILIDPTGQEHQGTVTGGEAKGDGESTDNEAEVKGKVVTNEDGTGGDVNGGTSEEGDSKRNKADVEDSTIEGDVNGGKSENGDATDNEAEVDGSTVGGDVNGGRTDGDGGTKNNKAKVRKGSKIGGGVNGGHSGGNGGSTGNEAEVDGSEVSGDVNGGKSEKGDADKNESTVSGGSTVTGNVNGGESEGDGNADENKTTVSGSTVGGNVNGGHSGGNGNTNGNEATVDGSKVNGNVNGGKSDGSGNSNENKADVKNGSTVGGNVTGGESETGSTNKNETTVSGSKVNGDVTGGKNGGSGTANENKVDVSGSTVGGNVTGGQSKDGPANENKTTVSNSNVGGDVTGGKSETGSASSNEVSVSGGSVGGSVYGGKTGGTSAEANENTVTLDNGVTVNGSVYGGYSENGDASGNTVNIGTGKINGDIYGGFGSGSTINNTVTLYGGADVSSCNIIGGNGSDTTGNTLNLGTSSESWASSGGQNVKNISGFSTLNFNNTSWSDSAALNITDGTSSDLSGTTINASNVNFSGIKTLSSGSTMTLLNQSKVTPDSKKATLVNSNSNFTIGTAVEGTGKVSIDENGNVIYSVESSGVSEQTHNTVMAAEAAMLAIDAGNDSIREAQEEMFRSENKGADGEYSFAKMGGGSLRQKTGSHVNVRMWNGVIAVGRKAEKGNATIEYGAFIEHGRGNFTTFNDNSQRGDGKVEYTGGGVLGKMKKNDGVYYEGSVRVGSIHEETSNILRSADQAYGYKGRAHYMGFHLGVGKEIAVNNGDAVDVYGRYYFNHKGGMNYEAGGDYEIDAVNSHVLRLGARYTMKRDKWNFYGDLAYEHEFDGKAEGRANGLAIRGADTSGGSVRLELGATFKESEESPWSLSLDMTGYAGNKQGIKGGVSVNFAF